MVISTIADGITRTAQGLGDTVSGAFFEPTIRLGVTGLARAGKTVFITSLVANLMDRGRMTGLAAQAEGRIEAAFLQPQPDDTIPRFDYEEHLARLTGRAPEWPDSTRSVSELRLSLRVRPGGLLGGFQGPRTIHLDIVDYPGEWLLDLGLLDKSYAEWSAEVLARIEGRTEAQAYLLEIEGATGQDSWDEPRVKALAERFTRYMQAARKAGYYDLTPGRFLMPGDLEGSPVLTFAPLPPEDRAPRKGLWREMERRFDAYKARVVKPFFRDHFSRIDRQVVLVDALGAINAGPRAVEDLQHGMADILSAFKPGRNAWLSQILRGKRVEKILFAATKADHIHHTQHGRLTAFMQAVTRQAADRAKFAGAKTEALSIAALRATTEDRIRHDGSDLDVVRGRLMGQDKLAAFYPGELPEDPGQLLNQARAGETKWLDGDYKVMNFAPASGTMRPGDGPPHIRLDRAAQFLIGDRL
ncbi:YcjX family protein [Mesobacterium pallidum]|uniref:YcjX family protein n=1 Tax=Mesobacterium pallidum TaxID=2872037 RepID=UPI001EE1A541|nr:YcjX family protein [Mesobacterium pallidum]